MSASDCLASRICRTRSFVAECLSDTYRYVSYGRSGIRAIRPRSKRPCARSPIDTRVTPPLRAYAGLLEAYARRRRGDLTGAKLRIKDLGFVGRWVVAGPFDNEGKAGLDRSLRTGRRARATRSASRAPTKARSGRSPTASRPTSFRTAGSISARWFGPPRRCAATRRRSSAIAGPESPAPVRARSRCGSARRARRRSSSTATRS